MSRQPVYSILFSWNTKLNLGSDRKYNDDYANGKRTTSLKPETGTSCSELVLLEHSLNRSKIIKKKLGGPKNEINSMWWCRWGIWLSNLHYFQKRKKSGARKCDTAFVIHKNFGRNITNFKPIKEKIGELRVKPKFFNVDDSVKDEIYNRLKLVFDALPSKEVKIVLGDFSAKIELVHRETKGGHIIHDSLATLIGTEAGS